MFDVSEEEVGLSPVSIVRKDDVYIAGERLLELWSEEHDMASSSVSHIDLPHRR